MTPYFTININPFTSNHITDKFQNQKSYLADKYRHIPLGSVNGITLDEMKVFNKGKVSRKFIMMARDAETGNVLGVTREKGSDNLKIFDLSSTDIRKRL